MAMDQGSFAVQEGDHVYGSDGDKVGTVTAVEHDYVVVEKGFFFPTDYYIPTSAIQSYEAGMLTLNVTKDVALDQGWDTVPVSETTYLGTERADLPTGGGCPGGGHHGGRR